MKSSPFTIKTITVAITVLCLLFVAPMSFGQKNDSKRNDKITICHYPPGNPENVQSITIDKSAWDAHKEHGDTIGQCDKKQDNDKDKNDKITICHLPPGNPDNVQTITIDASAWPAHEEHGDSLGSCADDNDDGDDDDDDNDGDDDDDNYPLPTAEFKYEKVIVCEGEEAVILIELEGNGPWTITYNDGVNNVVVENITSDVYGISTSQPGIYKLVSVVDSNEKLGTASNSTEVAVLEKPDVTVEGATVFCQGESAEIKFKMTGAAPWTIEYTDGTENFNFTTESNVYTIVANKTAEYTVTSVTDRNSCTNTTVKEASYSIEMVALPSATISGGGEICAGGATTLNFEMGGVGPWTVIYSNENSTHQFTTDQTNYQAEVTEAGAFHIVSVNNNQCTTSGEGLVSIKETSPVEGTIVVNGNYCDGDEIQMSFDTNYAGDLSINWKSNGTGTFVDADGNSIVYRPTAADKDLTFNAEVNNGCVSKTITAATVINKMNVDYNVEPAGSNMTTLVEYTFVPADMDADSYKWTFSDGTVITDQIAKHKFMATTGTVTVKLEMKKDGCDSELVSTETVSPYNVPAATFKFDEVEVCEGEDAVLAISLAGIGPWTVTYSDGTKEIPLTGISSADYDIPTTKPGVYSLVSVVDANGIPGMANSATKVIVNEKPDLTIEGVNTICEGESTEIKFKLTGEGPWTIDYSDGVSNHTAVSSTDTYTLVTNSATEYRINSIKAKNCTNIAVSEAFHSVQVVTLPTAIIDGGGEICAGGTTNLNFELGGVGPWKVVYGNENSTFEFTTDQPSYVAEVNAAGAYHIMSVNNGQCSTSGEGLVSIKQTNPITGSVVVADSYCEGDEILLEFDADFDGEINIMWETTGDGTFVNPSGNVIIYRPASTDEELSFTASLSNACEANEVMGNTAIRKLNASYSIEPAMERLITNVEYTFVPTDLNAEAYTWTFGDGTVINSAVATHAFSGSDLKMSVQLKIEKDGCQNEYLKSQPIYANTNLYVPSVFNPESTNSENSVLKVYGGDVSNQGFTFEVYNRWGLVVYSTKSFEKASSTGWNGRSKRELQENGVYTYILRGMFNSGEKFEKTGTISLIK